ncbi:GAP family protein [Mycolicibacterium sp. XJ870]
MDTAMWSTVLVMAVVAGTDPLRIGVVAYMVSRRRPVRLLLPFFVVGFTVNLVVGAVVVFVLRNTAVGGGAIPPAVEIAIGGLALLIAVLSATGSLERMVRRVRGRRAVVGAGVGEQATGHVAPPTLDSLPIVAKLPESIKAALRGEAAWAAGLLGLSNGIPTPYYLAAMAAAITAGVSVGQQLAALVVFNLVGFGAALIPIISFWVAPDATRSGVERIYSWMRIHHRLVVAVIAGAVGVFFVGLGISHL